MDGFPSGQRGQTVNLLQFASALQAEGHRFEPYRSHLMGNHHRHIYMSAGVAE